MDPHPHSAGEPPAIPHPRPKALKILLIRALAHNRRETPYVVPLGLLYVAAALRQAGYGRISVLDAGFEELSHDETRARIGEFAPDLVGISVLSADAAEAHALAALVKRADARCKVVVGGTYASSCPEAVVKDPNLDFAVIGEGERTVCELADALENGKGVSGIGGLAYRDAGGAPVVNPRRAAIEDLDTIPFPAWDLLGMEKYLNSSHRNYSVNLFPSAGRVLQIFTSRGCPFSCIYCSCYNVFGKGFRPRSPENVLREIELLVEKYAAEEIEILDDIFNYDLDRAKRICDGIIKRGIKVHLSFLSLRADRMDEELIGKMKEAGARCAFYAVETASPAIQKRIGKHLDLAKAAETIRATAALGIFTGAYFMFGFPDETREDMLKTIEFAQKLPIHMALFFYVTPCPHTQLYALLEKKKNIDLKSIISRHYGQFSVNLSAATDEELKNIWAKSYARFYLRPAQWWRLLMGLPCKRRIPRFILGTLRYAFFG